MAYATTTPDVSSAAKSGENPAIRRIGLSDLWAVLAQGYADFTAIPTQLVFLCLLYPVIGMVAARAATNDLLPLLFPLLTGLSLMGPVLAVGLYELSRRREAGLRVSWLNAFDVLRSPAFFSIVLMGGLMLIAFGLWVAAARAIWIGTVGPAVPEGLGGLANLVLHTGGGHRLVVLGNLVGLVFAVVVMTISVVSIPMLLDRNCSPALAMQTSVRAVAQNPATMAVWGLIVAALLVAGSIPVFIGLAVVMPVLGHATWHLYRRLVG